MAFVIAGIVAAFSVYSYAKLGSAYPRRGGAAVYLGVLIGAVAVIPLDAWDRAVLRRGAAEELPTHR